MSHPKKGTKACEQATKRWRESMIKKYGSVEAFKAQLIKQGSKGGKNGHDGGFKSSPERAKMAGAKGGKLSRRGYKLIEKYDDIAVYRRADGQIVEFKIKD